MSGYRSGYGRRRHDAPTTGRIPRANKRPGPCHYCGAEVPANGGQLWRNADGSWSAVHSESRWAGSPVSGRYVGGCPEETARLNNGAPWDSRRNAEAPREAPRDNRGGYLDECGSCGMASCAC